MPQGVELVSVAVAIAFWDVLHRCRTRRGRFWSVADASGSVGRPHSRHVVADAIGVSVFSAVTTTLSKSVELVAVTVAVAFRDVSTSALVDLTWSVTDATSVEFSSHTVVHVVADAIGVSVFSAVTTRCHIRQERRAVGSPSQSQCPSGMSAQSALVDLSHRCQTPQDASSSPTGIVHVVTDAIGVSVFSRSHRHMPSPRCVELVSVAVAVAFRDVRTDAALVEDVSVAVALQTPHRVTFARFPRSRPRRRRCTSASRRLQSQSPPLGFGASKMRRAGCRRSRSRLLGCPHHRRSHSSRSVADATFASKRAPRSRPRRHRCHRQSASSAHAITATDLQLVEDVSVAVAVAFRDVRTSALVDLVVRCIARHRDASSSPTQSSTSSQMPSASHSSSAQCHHTLQSVELVSVAVAVAFRDVRLHRHPSLVDLAIRGRSADATSVETFPPTQSSYVVTDAIGVSVFSAVTATHRRGRRAGFRRSRSRLLGCPHMPHS